MTAPAAPRLVHRTAHIRLRVTRWQARRCYGLLRSAGDVWAWLLDSNRQRHQQGERPVTGYQALCRHLHDTQRRRRSCLASGHPPDDPASGGCRSPRVPDLTPGEDHAASPNRANVA
jgi:hypothetical protein